MPIKEREGERGKGRERERGRKRDQGREREGERERKKTGARSLTDNHIELVAILSDLSGSAHHGLEEGVPVIILDGCTACGHHGCFGLANCVEGRDELTVKSDLNFIIHDHKLQFLLHNAKSFLCVNTWKHNRKQIMKSHMKHKNRQIS